jgi:hypothetical protein
LEGGVEDYEGRPDWVASIEEMATIGGVVESEGSYLLVVGMDYLVESSGGYPKGSSHPLATWVATME